MGDDAARTPHVVLTAGELIHFMDRILEDAAGDTHGYTQRFSWKKTDISSSVDGTVAASRQVLGGDVEAIGGWIVAETTGTASAAFRLHDGNSATTEQVGRVNLIANESVRDFFPGKGIEIFTGRIFVEVLSGSFEGVILWR